MHLAVCCEGDDALIVSCALVIVSCALVIVSCALVSPGEVGLEVCAGKGTTAKEAMKSGLWHPCDPVEGTITINIGDALQYWSDDRLKSTFHRVRVPRHNEYKVLFQPCW